VIKIFEQIIVSHFLGNAGQPQRGASAHGSAQGGGSALPLLPGIKIAFSLFIKLIRCVEWCGSRAAACAPHELHTGAKHPLQAKDSKDFVMDSHNALRIEDRPHRWGGSGSQPGSTQQQRARKLQSLYEALQAGDLDHARQAFLAMIKLDPLATSDPVLSKIGAALQSSNLPAARQYAAELNVRGGSFLAKFAQKIDDVMPAKPMFMLDDLGVAHVDFKA
jgi:hypothetical protein